MCGRYSLAAPASAIQRIFGLPALPELLPRFNVAPGTKVPGILTDVYGPNLEFFRWGLVPSWAKDAKIGYRALNARGEDLATKPMFRSAFKRRRLLVPVDGFYEWQKLDGGAKQAWHIRAPDGEPMAFGGLWEIWKDADGAELKSLTIVTTTPNEVMAPIHDRMPVILPEASWETWLNPDSDPSDVQGLIQPYAGALERFEVSDYVNHVKNEGPKCREPSKGPS
jgi:putative SOS response-associated peptidase YedK